MSGNLLEPRSLVRAAKRHGISLERSTAEQICALLEVSRGITLVGRPEQTEALAEAIVDSLESPASRAVFRRDPMMHDVNHAIERGEWIILRDLPRDEVERVLQAIGRLITPLGPAEVRPAWRVILTHEPGPDRMLPPIPVDLRRHFPMVEIGGAGLR